MGNAGWKRASLDPWDWEFSLFFRAFTPSGLVPRGLTACEVPGPHPLCCGLRDLFVPKAKRSPGPRLRQSNAGKGGPPQMMLLGGWGRWLGTRSPFGWHQGHASMTQSLGSTPSPAADAGP